ncbi:hypothetical protein [Alicycliphilus denitrificans]|uniref:hypothetical protein n=1 Tax=Alicycliphilus denitrificans TaxID=179636 RepID=UPI0001DA0B31|nr:hypothetical protein [Alicycliphilus denitrificans]ADV01249.1 hypothetical protein Alide_3531 [Alicycliphilus denitrificans BC]
MAANTFTLGSGLKYEAAERMRYNDVDGILWIKRVRCADGSGWAHDGKAHLPLRATRREVVEHFGQVYRPELVNA